MNRPFRSFTDDFFYVLNINFFRQPSSAVDVGLRHGAAGIGLESDGCRQPLAAEAVEELCPVAPGGAREAVVEPVRAFEHRARPDEPGARQVRGANSRLRRPARMHALGPRALREVLDDARGHRTRYAQRMDELIPRE